MTEVPFPLDRGPLDPGPLDPGRRRMLYRATHRGTAECDHLLGGFVSARIAEMNQAELIELETLLALPDPDLVAWLTGRRAIPLEHDGPLLRTMRDAVRR
ncbi:MAG: succinate dehydrogenase assembly factor 2 [Acetobacteraceae bacterium]